MSKQKLYSLPREVQKKRQENNLSEKKIRGLKRQNKIQEARC